MSLPRKKIFFTVFSFIFLVFPSWVLAQAPSELESCFTYYDYGKIQVHLTTEKTSYQQGETVKLQGAIVNSNTFPLTNVNLYAHLKRVNDTGTFVQNGHFLVDRLTLAENLNFLPGETKWMSVSLPILPTYPNGKYELQYFLFSKYGFHYGGRPFLEEDTAGYSTFQLEGGLEPNVYFDLNSLRVANQPHNIRELTTYFEEGNLPFEVYLIDSRETKTPITATIRWYSFEDTFEENLVESKQVILQAGEKVFKVVFTPPEPGAYVMLLEIDSPIRSLFRYRFAAKGETSSQLRMNDLGVTNFPPKDSDRIYVCFHSPMFNLTPQTQITLALLDNSKQLIDQKEVTGVFSGEVSAISLPVDKLTTPTDFWLKAKFTQPKDSKKGREVEVHYNCDLFDSSMKFFTIAYDKTKSNNLLFQAENGCGGKVRTGGYIESLRISQDSQVKQEFYNLTAVSESLPLEGLSPGNYQAEVKSGGITRVLDFTISSSVISPFLAPSLPPEVKKPTTSPWHFILVIVLLVVIIFLYLWWRRRKKQKEAEGRYA